MVGLQKFMFVKIIRKIRGAAICCQKQTHNSRSCLMNSTSTVTIELKTPA